MHQNAIIGIQRHHVGDTTQGHQIKQLAQVRLWTLSSEPTCFSQPRTQRQQHIEHHADAGQRLTGERTARLVGIDDGIRRRQLGARQVVIGNQHSQPRGLSCGHALDAGNTIVHGDQQLRLALKRHRNDFRGQAIAILETIGYQVIDMCCAEHAQPQHTDRAGGGTIGIEVADDQHALALLQP